jgi:hypothetical protein
VDRASEVRATARTRAAEVSDSQSYSRMRAAEPPRVKPALAIVIWGRLGWWAIAGPARGDVRAGIALLLHNASDGQTVGNNLSPDS